MTKHNVKTVAGLQSLLSTVVADLMALESRDLHTIRATISAVKSGNSLLRTEAAQRPKRKQSKD